VDHGFCRCGVEFVILAESSGPVEPGKGSFDDPSLGKHFEGMLFVPFEDLDIVVKHFFGPVDQLAGVAAVGEDLGDRVEAAEEPHHHSAGPNPVLDAGRMHHHGQQMALRIGRDVALAALDLLACVVSPPPPFRAVLAD